MFTRGQVVICKCGRDKAYPFLVKMVDKEFAYIVDGKRRKLDKPKKKKFMHLQKTNYIDEAIKSKIDKGEYLLDSDIRKALEPYKKESKED